MNETTTTTNLPEDPTTTMNVNNNDIVNNPPSIEGERESISTTSPPSLVDETATNSSLSSSNITISSLLNNDIDGTEGVREEYVQKAKDFEELLEEVTKMILDYYYACGRPTETTVCGGDGSVPSPEQILEELGPMKREAGTNEECLDDLRLCFRRSLKTMHPFFLDKLYFGTDPIGQIAELVVAVLNSNTHVYHVSPVFSTMEIEVVRQFGNVFFPSATDIDGTLNPGGSMSNMMALLLARNEHFPHVKKRGWNMEQDRPVAFTAAQSHYSISSAAMISGMGTERMIQIPCDRKTYQTMDPDALEKSIQNEIAKGNKPFFVNSVAGSTVLGTFDDFRKIGQICRKYNLWYHVDACWGGYLVFSSSSDKLFDGLSEYVDSVSFNPHKGLGVPQQCSMLLVQNKKDAFIESNGSDAEYLFQKDTNQYDIGDKTLGCGRKGDALKLWLTMRKYGFPDGFRTIADNELTKARHMTHLVQESEDFELVIMNTTVNVSFWYIPPFFSGGYTKEQKSSVHKIIFQRMKSNGHCLIQQQPLTELGLPNFFRLALGADRTRLHDDMEFLLDEIRRLGHDITAATTKI